MLSSAYHHLGWLLLIPLRSTIYCHSMLERLFFNFFRSETPFIDHLEKVHHLPRPPEGPFSLPSSLSLSAL